MHILKRLSILLVLTLSLYTCTKTPEPIYAMTQAMMVMMTNWIYYVIFLISLIVTYLYLKLKTLRIKKIKFFSEQIAKRQWYVVNIQIIIQKHVVRKMDNTGWREIKVENLEGVVGEAIIELVSVGEKRSEITLHCPSANTGMVEELSKFRYMKIIEFTLNDNPLPGELNSTQLTLKM